MNHHESCALRIKDLRHAEGAGIYLHELRTIFYHLLSGVHLGVKITKDPFVEHELANVYTAVMQYL